MGMFWTCVQTLETVRRQAGPFPVLAFRWGPSVCRESSSAKPEPGPACPRRRTSHQPGLQNMAVLELRIESSQLKTQGPGNWKLSFQTAGYFPTVLRVTPLERCQKQLPLQAQPCLPDPHWTPLLSTGGPADASSPQESPAVLGRSFAHKSPPYLNTKCVLSRLNVPLPCSDPVTP